jgi:3-hydroxyacyl-CoA dehydrogenase
MKYSSYHAKESPQQDKYHGFHWSSPPPWIIFVFVIPDKAHSSTVVNPNQAATKVVGSEPTLRNTNKTAPVNSALSNITRATIHLEYLILSPHSTTSRAILYWLSWMGTDIPKE